MNEIRKVVVTGSNGFIGRHLCRQLDAPGIELQSTRRRLSKSHTGDHYDNHIDVTNIDKLHESIKEADIIVHLAAKSSVPDSFNNPYETYYTNILGTLNLLELARRRNVSNFLFISTYIYGQPKYLPVDEKHQVNPHSPYQRSKLAAEKLCENYSHDFGVNVVTLRPFYVYGPNSRSYSFISSAIRQIKNSGTVVLSGERTARDFLYVSDLVKLIEIIIKNFPKGYNVYNVG